MLKDFGRRSFASAVSILVIVVLLLFAYQPLFQYVVAAAVAALAGVAIWEYGQFAKAKGGKVRTPILVALTVLLTFSFFAAARFSNLKLLPEMFFLFSILTLFACHFRDKEGAIVDLAVSSFGLLYVAVPLGMVLGILYLPMLEDGRIWVVYLLAVTKMTDIGAYFAGSLWGQRKLAPTISPAKTIEGAIGGLLCALVVSIAFYWIGLSMIECICLGLVLGCIGQFGDLAESLLKRDANKKDSNALPGLGGVLDSVDSLLFNAPILYFFLYMFKSS